MNSLIFSSQNKITTITSVLWEYTNNGGASYQDLTGNISPTYNGTAFTIRVKSVTPAEATYSQTGTASITNVADTTAQLTITGTNPYTGSYTSPTITITAASINGNAASGSSVWNNTLQSFNVITGVLPTGATYSGSVNATGTDPGDYTSSITGTGNYTGSVSGGTFTITGGTLDVIVEQYNLTPGPPNSYNLRARVTNSVMNGALYTDDNLGTPTSLTTTFQETGFYVGATTWQATKSGWTSTGGSVF
jgi:hypothetical protein